MSELKLMQTNIEAELNPVNTLIKHNTRSNKYQHKSSQDLINFFLDRGYQLQGTSFGNPRKQENLGYQKHVMAFTKDDLKIDDNNFLQVLVTNSHNGTTPVIINLGVYRLVCANGLVVGDNFLEKRVKHIGNDFTEKLDNSLIEVAAQAPLVRDKVELFKSVNLEVEQIKAFADQVAKERLKNVKNLIDFSNKSVRTVRRDADMNSDLYTVMNRIQENAIRGGITYRQMVERKNKHGQISLQLHSGKCRAIKAIDAKTNLNKFIWDIAESFAA